MKNVAIGLSLLFIGITAFGQDINKAPNGSFEELDGKVKEPGQITTATGWYSPEDTPPADIYSMDAKKEEVQAPSNYRGNCEPLDGNAYAGLRAFSERNREPRQYIQAKMDKKLIEGKKYCIKMSVSLSDLSNTGINTIGMLLTSKGVDGEDIEEDGYKPQLLPYENGIVADLYEWTTYCATYIADGSERYITIGSFEVNADNIETERVKRPREFKQPQQRDAYYYIDDVSVIAVGHLDEPCDCTPKNAGGPKLEVVYTKSTSSDGSSKDDIEGKVLHFDNGISTLTDNQKSDLDEIASLMKEDDAIKIVVTGHTDAKEDARHAEKRAKEVYTYLASNKGIDANRITYKGVGNEEALNDGGTPAEEAQNRRVEFKVE